ncbi:ABC transporter permease [Anaerorhabdus furcosa]|uniref:Putative ABC transport system permease protein n=1 Tax=Anaerorhabdus furcosa TaxID=118967 RepID=A0A1T4LGE8_9FIRM|nr:ABC transporter permease [Anaerorhabdus furcosa]SJZ53667.1 putative ABC transport system permease protein [Anaerorhabdus furcosa]
MIFEYIKLSVRELLNNKLRSFLSLIGIVIGVAVVFIIFSISDIANVAITNQITGTNGSVNINYVKDRTDKFEVLNQSMNSNFGGMGSKQYVFDLNDLEDLKQIKGVEDALAVATAYENVKVNRDTFQVAIRSAPENFMDFYEFKMVAGNSFDAYPKDERINLAIINDKILDDYLQIPAEQAIGQKIKIKNRLFTIAGVTNTPNQNLGTMIAIDQEAYDLMYSKGTIQYLSVKVKPGEDLETTSQLAVDKLNEIHGYQNTKNGYALEDLSFFIQQVTQVTGILSLVMGIIASISLLVAGIGVMNIMLVSVVERTREIGVKRAIGASKSAIRIQFIVESCLLTLIGGIIGVTIGIGVIKIALMVLNMQLPINGSYVAFALVFSITLGILFGYLPSKRAANLNIIEAIQSE